MWRDYFLHNMTPPVRELINDYRTRITTSKRRLHQALDAVEAIGRQPADFFSPLTPAAVCWRRR